MSNAKTSVLFELQNIGNMYQSARLLRVLHFLLYPIFALTCCTKNSTMKSEDNFLCQINFEKQEESHDVIKSKYHLLAANPMGVF